MDRSTPYGIRTERFEVDQYVRVQLSNGRSEIGVVVKLDEVKETATISTRNGYEVTVHLSSVRRAFLLVLDLNGVLVARGRWNFVDRPGVKEFIKFVMDNFVVAVWTSGLERTSVPIIDKIFDGIQDRLLFQFYRDSCTQRPLPGKLHHTVKNLQKIFDAYPKSFNAVNTIIVDDSPDKCSHPDIALCPVSFKDPEKQKDDNGLEKAMEVLKEVLRVDSHVPLIRASEERLLALAAKEREENECKTVHDEKGSLQKAALNTQDFDCGGVNEDNGSKQKKKNNNRNKKRGKKNSPPEEPLERGNSAPQDTNSFDHRSSCGIVGGNSRRSEYLLNHDPADGKCARSRRDQCERGHANRRMNSREERREPAGVAVTTATRSVTETATEVPSQRRGLLEGFDLPINVPLFSTHPDMQKGMLVRPTSTDPHRHAVSKQLQQLFALQNEQLHGEHQGPTSNKRGNGESNSTEVRTSSGTLRFTSNGKDGGALLRHLQAALNTTEKGGDTTSTKRT